MLTWIFPVLAAEDPGGAESRRGIPVGAGCSALASVVEAWCLRKGLWLNLGDGQLACCISEKFGPISMIMMLVVGRLKRG